MKRKAIGITVAVVLTVAILAVVMFVVMPRYQRMMGHCGERIFSMWLYQRLMDDPRIRLHQQPFLQCSQTVVENLPGNYTVADLGPEAA